MWPSLLIVTSALLLILLLAPARVQLDVRWRAPAAPTVIPRVRWLLVRWTGRPGATTAPPDAAPPDARTEPGEHAETTPGKPRRSRRGFHAWAALTTPGFAARVVGLVRDLLHVITPRRVVVRGHLGLDDPARTGTFYGMASGLAAGFSHASSSWTVDIEPDFAGAAIDVDAEFEWSASLAQVIWPATTFLASPVTWRAIRAGRRAR